MTAGHHDHGGGASLADLSKEPKVLGKLFDEVPESHVARRIKQTKVVRGVYDVPYLSGPSTDGKTVYIDKRVPARLEIKTKDGKHRSVDVAPFLLVHEITERILLDLKHPYLPSHHVATRREREAVDAAGLDWRDYEDVMDGYVRESEHESVKRVPPDLDLRPYAAFGAAASLRKKQNAEWGEEKST